MSFRSVDPGTRYARTFMNMHPRIIGDYGIGRVYPIGMWFALPADIWHLSEQVFLRAQPMLSPILTNLNARIRAWFVPLRQIEENTELIITGAKKGKFDKDVVIPSFNGFFADASGEGSSKTIDKYSVADYMSFPPGDYSTVYDIDGIPAEYWLKGYAKIWFDWYRDQNLSSYDDFDDYWDDLKIAPGKMKPFYANWSKDYFTSALPFQQKGIAPTLQFNLYSLQNDELVSNIPVGIVTTSGQTVTSGNSLGSNVYGKAGTYSAGDFIPAKLGVGDYPGIGYYSANTLGLYSNITTTDTRTMFALQRILERGARCGSVYVDFLRANFFGVAPADETLQRVKYLGGYKQPIVVSQVEQTAEDGTTPVGTLRGKGVSFGQNKMPAFACKEFGLIYLTLEIMPKALYTNGINRQFTYKNRFDIFNPSLQHLSEQEIRTSELYVDLTSKANCNETFGFTEMYNELRYDQDHAVGDMRGTMSYWTLPRVFASSPQLSETFIQARDDFTGPWAWQSDSTPQFIAEILHNNGIYRPMSRFGTPGFVDHG